MNYLNNVTGLAVRKAQLVIKPGDVYVEEFFQGTSRRHSTIHCVKASVGFIPETRPAILIAFTTEDSAARRAVIQLSGDQVRSAFKSAGIQVIQEKNISGLNEDTTSLLFVFDPFHSHREPSVRRSIETSLLQALGQQAAPV